MFITPTLLGGQADSLRQAYADALAEDPAGNLDFRLLMKACDGAPDCIKANIDWAAGIDAGLEAKALEYAGDYFAERGQPDLAINYFHQGLATAEASGNDYMRGVLYNRLGYAYTHFKTDSDSAAHHLYASIAEFENTEDFEIWQPYYNLAYLSDQIGLRERAVEMMEKSYLHAKKGGRRSDYGFVLYHLLSWAINDQRTELLDRYFPEYTEFRAGARSLDPQHDALLLAIQDDDAGFAALSAYEAGLGKRDTIFDGDLNVVYSVLGAAHEARGNYKEAIRFYRQGLSTNGTTKRTGNQARTYRQIAGLGRKMNDPELVAYGLENFQAIRDSMAQAEYQASISRMEVEYETQKARVELAESELSLSESRRQLNQLLLGGLALLSLLVGGFVYYQSRLKLQRLRAEVARENQVRELAEVRRQSELSNLRALIEGQEAERSRVAKDLHDGLGGLLTTVKAHVSSIPNTKEAEVLIDRACTSVRRIAHNMMPQTLAQSGLAASLGDLAAQLRVQGFDVDLEVIGKPEDHLDLPRQSIILRIAQELTHNVVKHSGAKSILLQLIAREEKVLLTVEDDGQGFNLDHARRAGGGLGLASIEQRVDYLEGTIMFDSRVGVGTTVSVEI